MIDQDAQHIRSSKEDDGGSEQDVDQGPRLIPRLRSYRTLASFAVAFIIVFFVFRNLDVDIGLLWANVRAANPFLLILGFAAYYVAFPLRALRWQVLLQNAAVEQGPESRTSARVLTEFYVLGWFANCLVPAKLGDAYRGYLFRQRTRSSFARTMGTILAERFFDVLGLVVFMGLAAVLLFGSGLPSSVRLPLIGGAALAVVGIVGLGGLYRYRVKVERVLPHRAREHYQRLQEGVFASFGRPGAPIVIGTTLAIWTLEGVRVFLVAAALQVVLSPPEALFVALLASLLTVVPLTPAGLGVVESGAVVALKLLGIAGTDAASVAIVDRIVAYWSVILVGGVLYLVVKRR